MPIENIPQTPLVTSTPQDTSSQIQTPGVEHHKKNIYPATRHILLVACVLLALCIIVFLIHQNGKSIYDNGL